MRTNLFAVLPLLAPTIGGAACLPLTFNLTREGGVFPSVAAVAAIAVMGSLLSTTRSSKKIRKIDWRELPAFAIGALISETAFFTYYLYMQDGRHDPKLAVGIAVVVIEFLVIATVGILSIWITKITIRWLAKPRV